MCSKTSFLSARGITLAFLSALKESIDKRRSRLVPGCPHPQNKERAGAQCSSSPGDWNWESRKVTPVVATLQSTATGAGSRAVSLLLPAWASWNPSYVWAVGVCYCHSKGINTLVHALRRLLAEPGWQPCRQPVRTHQHTSFYSLSPSFFLPFHWKSHPCLRTALPKLRQRRDNST